MAKATRTQTKFRRPPPREGKPDAGKRRAVQPAAQGKSPIGDSSSHALSEEELIRLLAAILAKLEKGGLI